MKKILFLITALLIVIFISSQSFAATEITIATHHSSSHPIGKSLVKLKEIIEETSNGEMEVELYLDAALGDERELLEQVMQGQIDIFLGGTSSLGRIEPKWSIFDAPYVFKDDKELEMIIRGPIGDQLDKELVSKYNIHLLDRFWAYGTRHLTTKGIPVFAPEDLEGVKIRTPGQQIYYETLEAMGASPTAIAFSELYMALSSGVIDGQENPPSTIYAYKFYEVQDYLMLTGHIIRTMFPIVNYNFFSSLNSEEQRILEEAAYQAGQFNNELIRSQDKDLISKFEDLGMKIIGPEEGLNIEAFKEKCKIVHEQRKDIYGSLYEQINSYLESEKK